MMMSGGRMADATAQTGALILGDNERPGPAIFQPQIWPSVRPLNHTYTRGTTA